ncbi:MFS transporter [Noviherbaspirillum sp. CPCC 100848]|uniref:MFS transporter n=1 Tax=Noviherbaspirillum album TaxID=3080276 RepID=A0ABU6JJ00_9BURK|nr:MFS transporter [Noviherbaspirillum sp. CPCC 100848]MEC4723441.1 MFS transporter [Noviherbaspirillum sp. CPCC 100848]
MQTDFRRDAQVIGLEGLAHGVSHFFHLILAPLFPWIKEAFGLSYAELGLLMTMFFAVSGVGQATSGFVVDRIGASTVLFFGMACLGVSALVLAASPNYAVLMLGSMLAGLGNSVFHPACFTLLNQRVSPARLSHAFSIHGVTGNLGWAAAPLVLVPMAGLFGWRMALLAAAGITFAVLALLFANRKALATEYDARTPHVSNPVKASSRADAFAFMRIPAVWMCFAFFLITALAIGGVQSFSASGLRDLYGVSLALATTAYTAYMLASAAGMLWGGFLAAKTSRHERTIAIGFAASGLFAFLIASGMVPPLASVALMAAVGFGSGIAGPSRDLLIRAAAPKNSTGRVYGVVYSGIDIGLAAAPLLFGALMDGSHPAWVFIGIGVFQFMALLTAIGVGSNTASRAVKAGAAA